MYAVSTYKNADEDASLIRGDIPPDFAVEEKNPPLATAYPANIRSLKDEQVASFAHSIKNPITSIKMRLCSLKRFNLSTDQREDLDAISEEISNIENLVSDFIEFTREARLRTEKISPSEVVDRIARQFAPVLRDRGIQLSLCRFHPLSEMPIDCERLKEVLTNLMVNASDAIGNKDGNIVIFETEIDNPPFGRFAVIEIQDNGNGIPEFDFSRIFQPFFTTKEEGTGLGLNITKKIIEAHGGSLTFTSSEKTGSTFRITLPIHS